MYERWAAPAMVQQSAVKKINYIFESFINIFCVKQIEEFLQNAFDEQTFCAVHALLIFEHKQYQMGVRIQR